MLKKDTTEGDRAEIEALGLNAIKDFFNIDPYGQIDKDTIQLIHSKARIAIQFEKEINLAKRAVELNYLRVFKLVAEDKKELKRLIKKSLPRYYISKG